MPLDAAGGQVQPRKQPWKYAAASMTCESSFLKDLLSTPRDRENQGFGEKIKRPFSTI
jgi:hypothetical protein